MFTGLGPLTSATCGLAHLWSGESLLMCVGFSHLLLGCFYLPSILGGGYLQSQCGIPPVRASDLCWWLKKDRKGVFTMFSGMNGSVQVTKSYGGRSPYWEKPVAKDWMAPCLHLLLSNLCFALLIILLNVNFKI